MNEYIKAFIKNVGERIKAAALYIYDHRGYIAAVCAAVLVCIVCYVLGSRSAGKDVHDNTDAVRHASEQLDRAEESEHGIADTAESIKSTVGEIAGAVDAATDASTGFDRLIEESQRVLDEIRRAGK